MEVGDPQLPTAKPSRGTLVHGTGPSGFAYGAVTLYGGAFQPTSATRRRPVGDRIPSRGPNNPTSPPARRRQVWFGLAPFRSPLLRGSQLVSFPPPTKMFPFGGFPSGNLGIIQVPGRHGFTRGRSSHSGIPGSTAACASPGHFAACRALLRRLSRAIHRAACCHRPWGGLAWIMPGATGMALIKARSLSA